MGLTKGPRPDDLCDAPALVHDPASDLIITVFTGGVFADEVVPAVRTWVCERVKVGRVDDLEPFIEAFTAMNRVKGRIAGLASPSTHPAAAATLATPLHLFSALYGFTPHNPEDVLRTEFLAAAQGLLLTGSHPKSSARIEIEMTDL